MQHSTLKRSGRRFPHRTTKGTYFSYRGFPGEWFIVSLLGGDIIDCSKDLAQLLGTSTFALRGIPISSLVSQTEEYGWGLKELSIDLIKNPGRYEDVGLSSGHDVPVVADVRVTHIRFRGKRVAFCLIIDKSQQRQLQGALISKHRELQQMVKELNDARKQLKDKNRQLGKLSQEARATSSAATIGEVAAELNHQLNNPLAAAMGANRSIRRMIAQGNLSEIEKLIELSSKALRSMKETTDEVKLIYKHSRIPTKEKEQFDLAEEIDSTLMLLEQKMERITLIQEIDDRPAPITAHRALVQHVLTNLLENAVEATEAKGRVYISLKKTDDAVIVEIGDNGPGIRPEYRNRVFDAFYTTKKKGSGLGLAAVKRYTDRDRAEISIGHSHLGGASFIVIYKLSQLE